MKQTHDAAPGGFVLLEILPAVLVFSVFLLLGFRMFWSGLRMEHESRRTIMEDAALLHAWNTWESTGGKAAIVVCEGNGSWLVYDFPDESWFPSPAEWADWDRGREWTIFRRRPCNPDSEQAGWEIEVNDDGIGQESLWKWKCRVQEPEWTGAGTRGAPDE